MKTGLIAPESMERKKKTWKPRVPGKRYMIFVRLSAFFL